MVEEVKNKVPVIPVDIYEEWLTMPVTKDFFNYLAETELLCRAVLSNGAVRGTFEEIGVEIYKNTLEANIYQYLREKFDIKNLEEGYLEIYPEEDNIDEEETKEEQD